MLTIRFDPRAIVLVGLGLAVIGAFLPWVHLPPFLVNDTTQWGLRIAKFLTLALSILGLLSLLWPGQLLRRTALPAAVLALLADLLALTVLIGLLKVFYNLALTPRDYLSTIGSGLYMIFIGALIAFLAGLWPAGGNLYTGATQPELLILALLAAGFMLLCACAALTGALLGPVSTALQPAAGPAAASPTPKLFPSDLLATPLIEVHVTLRDATPAPPSATIAPETTAFPSSTPIPPPSTPTATPAPPSLPSPTRTTEATTIYKPTPTSTLIPTPPFSPLPTPGAGK